jgi:hypothetical protein
MTSTSSTSSSFYSSSPGLISSSPSTSVPWLNGQHIFFLYPQRLADAADDSNIFFKTFHQVKQFFWIPSPSFLLPSIPKPISHPDCASVHIFDSLLATCSVLLLDIIVPSSRIISFPCRFFWSLCYPSLIALQIFMIVYHPLAPFNPVAFFPVWLLFHIVILVPFYFKRKTKQSMQRAIDQCNLNIFMNYTDAENTNNVGKHEKILPPISTSPFQWNQCFFFLQYNSPTQITIILSVKHDFILREQERIRLKYEAEKAQQPVAVHQTEISDMAIPVLSDSQAESCTANRYFLCIPLIEEEYNEYFQTNAIKLKESKANVHNVLSQGRYYIFLLMNLILPELFLCSASPSHAASFSPLLSSFLPLSAYSNLVSSIYSFLSISYMFKLISFLSSLFGIMGFVFGLTGIIYISFDFSSTDFIMPDLIVLAFIFLPIILKSRLRHSISSPLAPFLSSVNLIYNSTGIKLLCHCVNYAHWQFYAVVDMDTAKQFYS